MRHGSRGGRASHAGHGSHANRAIHVRHEVRGRRGIRGHHSHDAKLEPKRQPSCQPQNPKARLRRLTAKRKYISFFTQIIENQYF